MFALSVAAAMSAWEVDEPPAALDRMQTITALLKYGRQGNPHFRNFQVCALSFELLLAVRALCLFGAHVFCLFVVWGC